jgi:TolA-binding protein
MSQEPSVRELLAPMTERPVELDGPGFRVDREQVLARMAAARAAGRRERRGWVGYAGLAAASALLFIFGARQLLHEGGWSSNASLELTVSAGSATRITGVSRDQVVPNQRTHIAAAGELDTAADSQAKVRTTDGLQIELQSQTRVALGDLQTSASRVQLLGGAIRCTVAHRTAAHAFQVVTPDVTVVDLGTVFTVTVDEAEHATRVTVEEGEVMVQSASGQTRVQAPNSWSSAPPEVAPAQPTAAPELGPSAANAPNALPVASAKSARLPAPAVKEAPAATLAQEAQLLRQGLAAERQGHAADAISALTTLLAKYPNSPLAPDARAALARVQASPSQ